MKWLMRRTLARRILLGFLGTIYVLWLCIIVTERYSTKSTARDRLQGYANAVDKSLADVNEPDAVKHVLAFVRAMRNQEELLEAENPSGIAVFDNDNSLLDATGELPWQNLREVALGSGQVTLGDRQFLTFSAQGKRWRTVAVIDETRLIWRLLKTAIEFALILIALAPILLPPVWWAVRTGLRPLRRLTDEISQRSANDLSPVSDRVRYDDLQPLNDALNSLLTRLREALAREKAFIQDAAHELRTPLAVILAQGHVLVAADTPTARSDAARRLERALVRASHLTRQMLQLAQLEGREQRHQALDVMNLLRDSIAETTERATERGVEVTLDGPEQLPCESDAQALQCVIDNLLDNALRYGPQPGRIEVTVHSEPGAVTIRVMDDGPGIAPAQWESVFDRFHREQSADESGSGLGLAIVRQAARAMGGDVSLSTGLEGRGCCFAVRIALLHSGGSGA